LIVYTFLFSSLSLLCRPVSAYAVFFQEIHPIVKSENPTIKFGELTRLIAARWDALSREQKRDYRRRGARFNQDESHPLLAYKSRLHKSAEIQRSCCYPSCNKPIKWDPRWNGQYCSPSCVSEHCRLAFMDWCARKRLPLNAVVGNHLPLKTGIFENGYQKSKMESIDVKKESQSDLAVNSHKQCANDLSIHQVYVLQDSFTGVFVLHFYRADCIKVDHCLSLHNERRLIPWG
ncbi:uncharacterized protein DEA37_0006821, partial [Paragonimus westermani]